MGRLLTDIELRARWNIKRKHIIEVEEGTILTPAARDFIRENKIKLQFTSAPDNNTMTRLKPPTKGGKPVFIDYASGSEINNKPETMTHLRANVLVPKTDEVIFFRGQLDKLQAMVVDVAVLANEEGDTYTLTGLADMLSYLREMMAANVKEEPLREINLLGLSDEEIHKMSHDIKGSFGIDHPSPCFRQGKLCAKLNLLRTEVREVELWAARAYEREDGSFERSDIIQGLNRLSSFVYILYCKRVAEQM